MQQYPLVWLEDGFASRTERILGDYVVDLCAEFIARHGHELGFAAFADHLRQSLRNIVKRLGMERYQRLAAIMDKALDERLEERRVRQSGVSTCRFRGLPEL